MARDGSGIYTKPAGTTAVAGTTIESAKYNTLMDDIASDLNTDRPIVAGGTGESTVGGVRDAFEIDAKVVDKSGAYTALAADRSKLIRSTATMTLTLSLAATLGDGWFINVIADTGTLTIDGAGSETIDGSTTLVLTVGQKATIICDGTSFYTLNALTAVEMAQLQAIGAVTISSGQWTYLGAMDQGVATGDDVVFAAIDGPVGGTTPAAGTFTTITVDTDTLVTDATNNRVGIGLTNPSKTLEVGGDIGIFRDYGLVWLSAEGGGERASINSNITSDLIFNTGTAVEAMRIEADGAMLVGTVLDGVAGAGDIVVNGGIFLGGSAAANELNDYEEGTWTPVLSDAASGGNTASITVALAAYTKVGRLVTLHVQINDIDTAGMTSGNTLFVQGTPFAAAGTNKATGSVILDKIGVNATSYVIPQIIGGITYIAFKTVYFDGATSDGNLTVADVTDTTSDITTMTISYFA